MCHPATALYRSHTKNILNELRDLTELSWVKGVVHTEENLLANVPVR